MVTEVTSKSELEALAIKLETEITNLKTTIDSINSTLGSVGNYDGIDASSAASTLISNLSSLSIDAEIASKNIKNYAIELNNFDVDDLTTDSESESTIPDIESTISSTETLPPLIEDATESTHENETQTSTSHNNAYVPNTQTENLNSTEGNASTIIGGGIIGGIVSGSNSKEDSTSNSKPSNNTEKPSLSTGTIPSKGQTSSDGRTQRSALSDIVITEGDPNIDITRYHNNIENGFEVTAGNLAYQLCEEDIDLLCAIVAAESDKTYDDALAVITTILNRCERTNWIASHGRDPIAQATAPNQFVVYQHGSYTSYLNGNAPSTVVKAVQDALAGVRNHNYCNFRSNSSTSYSNNMITPTGNRYKNE